MLLSHVYLLQASGTLSTLGVLSGVTSSLFVALNGIYTKRALDMEEMDSVKLTLHINVNASFLLLFPSVLTGQVKFFVYFVLYYPFIEWFN